ITLVRAKGYPYTPANVGYLPLWRDSTVIIFSRPPPAPTPALPFPHTIMATFHCSSPTTAPLHHYPPSYLASTARLPNCHHTSRHSTLHHTHAHSPRQPTVHHSTCLPMQRSGTTEPDPIF